MNGTAIRTDLLRSAGDFLEEPINCTDIDMLLRLGASPGFVRVKAPASHAYREHAGNIKSNLDKAQRGIDMLLVRERSGSYPGGHLRRWDRRRIITMHLRVLSVQLLRCGKARQAWKFYRQTFGWHVRLQRWLYLLGFPALLLKSLLQRNAKSAS
jgi:hypothetical protein